VAAHLLGKPRLYHQPPSLVFAASPHADDAASLRTPDRATTASEPTSVANPFDFSLQLRTG